MAVSKQVIVAIAVVAVVVAFVAGVYSYPLIFPPPEPGPEDPIWASVLDRGVIRVGSSPDWPPYEYLDEAGEFTGFEVELMEMIAERLDLSVEWVDMGFDLVVPEVIDKAIDLGVSGFSIRPDRLEVVQYTVPHSTTDGQILMLESRRNALNLTEIEFLTELDDLGLTCGVGVGTTQQDELLEDAPDALRTYEDYLVALVDLKRGAIDSIYAETPVTSWWILEAEEAAEEPLVVIYRRPYWPVAFVAHKDADILVEKINGALAEIMFEGELDKLKAKWKCD